MLNLVDIPVVYICPAHNDKYLKRKVHMDLLLKNLGFKNVTMFKSGTESYPTCLAQATIDVLTSRLDDEPFILLEDDVDVTKWFDINKSLIFPQDTDAMYLGLAMGAGSTTLNVDDGPSQITRISNTHIKIHNMLGAHAILYVSCRYKQAVIHEMYRILSKVGHHSDVAISRIHSKFNIYGYHYPIFCQSNIINGFNTGTHFRFKFETQSTIVTAYYPIKSKNSNESYREWYRNFFKCVTADVVCFCPPELVKEFKSLARPNHQIVGRDFYSWEMMSEKRMEVWRELNKNDPEVAVGHTPELYAIWGAKQEFVREAMNLLDSEIFVWCDIGCFRDIRDGSFKLTKNFIQPSKITCLYLEKCNTIGGGVLAGDKNAWKNFSKNYIESLDSNPQCKDQVIFNRILNIQNANIIIVKNDEWFHLTSLFSIPNYTI